MTTANKSNTEIYYFDGEIKWAKLYEPDEFRGASRWMLNLYPDEKSLERYKKSGIQVGIKTDDDGQFVNLRRDTSRLFKGKGKPTLMMFTPPFIYDEGGSVAVSYVDAEGKNVYSYESGSPEPTQKGDTLLIGNGSKVRVRVSVFPTSMGKGHRLESVRILDLITYNPDTVTDNEVDEAEESKKTEPAKEAPKTSSNSNLPW